VEWGDVIAVGVSRVRTPGIVPGPSCLCAVCIELPNVPCRAVADAMRKKKEVCRSPIMKPSSRIRSPVAGPEGHRRRRSRHGMAPRQHVCRGGAMEKKKKEKEGKIRRKQEGRANCLVACKMCVVS